MKLTPAYSTYTRTKKTGQTRRFTPARGLRNDSTYLENNISGSLLRERLFGLFDNIDASGLGERDSFHGGRQIRHGWMGFEMLKRKDFRVDLYTSPENQTPLSRSPLDPHVLRIFIIISH